MSVRIYGAIVLAGIGAGMAAEKWIAARVQEDKGYVTIRSKGEKLPPVSEMEMTGIETRRDIKPGAIFRAHLTATVGVGPSGIGMSDIEDVIGASVRMQKADGTTATVDTESRSKRMLYGHEPVFSGDMREIPYHWGVSIPRFSCSREVNPFEGNMDELQNGVMHAIHDALSKEALIKKLIIPFNNTNLEGKKNTALLDLEHRNQQLQHRLNDAASQVMEAHARAEYDRNLLAETLQKRKEEIYLMGRADSMRTRLIERTQMMARSQLLRTSLFSWWRYMELCRKKRTLKKAETFWQRHTLAKKFKRFLVGCEKIRRKHQLNSQAKRHWLEKCFKSWWWRSQCKQEFKRRIAQQVKLRTIYVLRAYFGGWQEYYWKATYKNLQVKKARKVHSYNCLQKSWNRWKRHVEVASKRLVQSQNFFFHKLVGDCVMEWFNVVVRKKRHKQQVEMGIHLGESKALLVAFEIWYKKIRTVHVMKERLECFIKRKKDRFSQSLLTKWRRHVLRTASLRIMGRLLASKVKVWYMGWGFTQLKRRWVSSKLVEGNRTQRMLGTRLAVFHHWSWLVKQWKGARKLLARVRKTTALRRMQRSFYLWTVCAANSRRACAEDEADKLEVKIKVLEIDLRGAARVQNEMDKLLVNLESGKKKLMKSLEAAMARNPVWTSGFLDVLLRWTVPLLAWLPSARAGHSAISLPKTRGSELCTRVVVFGGYNGQEFFNDVFVFETDEMQWKKPVCSAADGCGTPSPRQTHAACAVGDNKMILLGGFDGTNDLSDLFILKISEDGLSCEWSQPPSVVGPKPGPLCQHTSCLSKDGPYMVVFGGYQASVGLLNELWTLDLNWMLWSSPDYFGTPPSPRRGHGAAIIGTKMFVFGGFDGTENLSDLHVLDLETMTWEIVETQGEVPSPRRQVSVAVVGQHFVVHGGFSGYKYLGDVFSFHANFRRWNKWPEKETQQSFEDIGQGGQAFGRSMHTMVECGQRLVIFGGVHEWGALQDVLFIENASAIEGLHLQSSLVEELEKAKEMQLKVTECEDAMRRKNMELIETREDIEDLRTTLQEEVGKRKKAVRGHHILSKKLQKARSTSDRLSLKCNRLLKRLNNG